MKKLLIGFLAVGLIMSFAMTASAQPNIKASGQLYMYGTYVDNNSLAEQWRLPRQRREPPENAVRDPDAGRPEADDPLRRPGEGLGPDGAV